MRIHIVTSAFTGLRTDRPDEYYTRPAHDLWFNAPCPVHVWTQPKNGLSMGMPEADPIELTNDFWQPGWQAIYAEAVKNNPVLRGSIQTRETKVVAAWLSKFEVMKRTFADNRFGKKDGLLWWDAGHPISFHCGGNVESYKAITINRERLRQSLQELAELPLAFCTQGFGGYQMPAEWMTEFRTPESKSDLYCQGIFLFVRRDAFQHLYDGVRDIWHQMVARGHVGTEENPLTVYSWQHAVQPIEYAEWCKKLGVQVLRKSQNPVFKIATRDEFGSELDRHGLKGDGVEVGVCRGDFADAILKGWKGRRLNLIDSWRHHDGLVDDSNASDAEHETFYRQTRERFSGRAEVNIIRSDSVNAAKTFTDGSLDFVYLDGDHSCQGVRADLDVWYTKVKSGGVLAGHDYLDGKLQSGDFCVKQVVDAFAASLGVDLRVTQEQWPTWYFRKP